MYLIFTDRFNDVKWKEQSIVVMGEVTIDPPYEEQSCRGHEQSREHIVKIVSIVRKPSESVNIN